MIKLHHFLKLFIVTFSINACASTSPVNFAVSSCSFLSDNSDKFCMLTSDESMDIWQYNRNITNVPAGINFISNEAAACVGNTCLSVGGYNKLDKRGEVAAFILRSADHGINWSLQNVTPADVDMAYLNAINCEHNECLAFGHYRGDNNKYRPLILASTDKLESWQQITDIAGIDPQNSIDFPQSACTSDYCVIAASSYDVTSDKNQAIFFHTGKDKKRWSATTLQKPVTSKFMEFNKVSCSQNTCAAAGYTKNNPIQLPEPMLYVSQNRGVTWENIPVGVPFSELNDVKCQDEYCIAVGFDHKNRRSLVTVSQDDGKTWIVRDIPSPQNYHSFLQHIDCTSHFCVTGGSEFYLTLHNQLGLYISQDQGNTWKFQPSIKNMPVIKNALLDKLSCNHESCIYAIEDGNDDSLKTRAPLMPILLISNKTGDQWEAKTNHENMADGINMMEVGSIYHG